MSVLDAVQPAAKRMSEKAEIMDVSMSRASSGLLMQAGRVYARVRERQFPEMACPST